MTFTQTSDAPYDRHQYKLIFEDGKQAIFDDYEVVTDFWYQRSGRLLSHIEVLDKPSPKGKTKGFM